MRQSFTAVLERISTFDGDFETEPYEAAWAGEARWFVRTVDLSGQGARVKLTTQISPDGLHWCDHEPGGEQVCAETGLVSWPIANFGQWLRLRATVEGADASAKVIIYLALKA